MCIVAERVPVSKLEAQPNVHEVVEVQPMDWGRLSTSIVVVFICSFLSLLIVTN